jgi:succinate dehydrogenase / fumarate reductase, membrane anchor subunit
VVHLVKAYTKNPVGAHYGLGDWLLQRLTAVVMVLYTLGFAACLLIHRPGTYADWKAIFSGTFVKVATMFFFVALLYHAWVGMRDILMDYIRATGLRLTLQSLVALSLLLYAIWAAAILWGRA